MIELLARIFIKNREKIRDERVRSAYGTLCSVTGIVLNLLLFAGKYLAGVLTASIAVTADAFNNLSDAGSSLISLLGFKLASRKPDPDHPYGHGRMEYISGFIIAVIILLLGFELGKSSFEKIFHPAEAEWSLVSLIILGASILVKGYMALYNNRIGKKIDSAAMRATSADSLSDMASTSVVLISTLLSHFFHWTIDGWCGLAVSLFILWNGFTAARDTLSPLLGSPADPEMVKAIADTVTADPLVSGLHDLMIHDYGPGRKFVSLHAEVPADCNILDAHDTIDNLERKLGEEFGVLATIHMDPVEKDNPETEAKAALIRRIAAELSPELNVHDFRMVSGETHTNLIFDILVPYGLSRTDEEAVEYFKSRIREELGDGYFAVIHVDKPFA